MSPDIETQLLSEVLQLNASVAALNPQLERLQSHVERVQGTTSNINERVGVIADAVEAHEMKIKQLEITVGKIDADRQSHHTWRARIGGAYVGIATFVGLTGAAIGYYLKYVSK